MYAGQNSVQQVQCALDDAQRSHGNAHLALRVHIEESLVGHVTLPVMQGHSAHGDPHNAANHVHDGVTELSEKNWEKGYKMEVQDLIGYKPNQQSVRSKYNDINVF